MEGAAPRFERTYFQEQDTLYLQKASPPGDLSNLQSIGRTAEAVAKLRSDRRRHQVPQQAEAQLVAAVFR